MNSDSNTFATISRDSAKKFRLRWSVAALVSVLGYFVLRILVIELRRKYGADSISGLYIEPIGYVLDSVFAGVFFAMFAYVMREELTDWLSGIRQVKTMHFNSLEECLKLLSEAIVNYRDNISRAHITMVSPLFFSSEYTSYYYDSKLRKASEDVLKSKKQRCNEYMHQFQDVIDLIIDSADGAYDKTLVGKTGIASIDRATYQIAASAYEIGTGIVPGTTELGFHSNLNEYATFIFGKCHKNLESEPISFDFMLLVHFDSTFENLCGYICFDEETIKQNYEFLVFKNDNADKLVISNKAKVLSQDEWSKFCSEFQRFLVG